MNIDDLYPPSLRLMIEQQQRLQNQFELPLSIRAVVEQQRRDMASISNASGSLLSQAVAERKLLDQAIAGVTSSLLDQAVAERKLLNQAIAGVTPSLLNQAVAERKLLDQAIAGNLAAGVRSWESVAESILGSSVGSFILRAEAGAGKSNVGLRAMARSFDDKDFEDDDDFNDAADSDEKIVIPSNRALILVTAQISDLLLAQFVRHPEELTQMPSRKFEELVAGLFEGFGYEVELTAQTRDGGYDIVAVRHAEMTTRSLIECKRHSPNNKVGVGVVRQLRGVVASSKATNGIVATTATFTRNAERFIAENEWLIEGRSINHVVEWINRYLRRSS
jgi:uncharacterized membrane-anchored protein YhcB (DUF1043 family)